MGETAMARRARVEKKDFMFAELEERKRVGDWESGGGGESSREGAE